MRVGVFWFTHDLRLHDNPALVRACMTVDRLICVFNFERAWDQAALRMQQTLGEARARFLEESVEALSDALQEMGHRLIITRGTHLQSINKVIHAFCPTDVFQSAQHGFYERQVWTNLQSQHARVSFHSITTHTLFDKATLPFQLDAMPDGFNAFLRTLETQRPFSPLREVTHLPPMTDSAMDYSDAIVLSQSQVFKHKKDGCEGKFVGGEASALKHVQQYFASEDPASYKQTRNALEGWSSSCKFSPWLALGCISVRKILAMLNQYERERVSNESTYWIYFELVWREYFQWYALRHGAKLFRFSGITGKKPLTSHYAERLMKWKSGSTPYPIVNACMNELRETGFLSNRGRQIAASCLINELEVDWRYGASYFEQMLIDYDVSTNWGNWQYLAGVGAATVSARHFNLEKQARLFDPESRYIKKWTDGTPVKHIDSVDMVDWPVSN